MTPWEEYLAKVKAKGRPQPFGMVPEAYPPEPTQPEPEEPDDSQALATAEGFRSIGEGLGNIDFRSRPALWNWKTGQVTPGPLPEQEPYVAEGPRMAIGNIVQERQNKLRLAVEAARQGFQAREGALGRASREGVSAENRAAANARFESGRPFREALIESTITNREQQTELAKERFEQTKEIRHRLSDKELEWLTKHEAAQSLLEDIIGQKPAIDTGPISAAKHVAARWVGLDDPQKAVFKANVQDQLVRAINELAGATMTRAEIAAIAPTMPRMTDNDAQFMARAERVAGVLEEKKNIFLEARRKAGKTVEPFMPQAEPTQPSAPSGGKIRVRRKADGRPGNLLPQDFDPAKYEKL